MTTKALVESIDATLYAPCAKDNIDAFYVGDFLSRVMGKAPSGCAWITVMNNINVAGVGVLADVAMIVLCEDVHPAEDLIERCKTENIGLVSTKLSAYEVCRNLK